MSWVHRFLLYLPPIAFFFAGDGQAQSTGVPFRLGDRISTAILPAGDQDDFAFEGISGTRVKLRVVPEKRSSLLPTLALFDPDGVELALPSRPRGQKLVVSSFSLAKSGNYLIRIGSSNDTKGGYELRTSGKAPRRTSIPDVTLDPGSTQDFEVGGVRGSTITATIRSRGGQSFEVVSVLGPNGAIPGGAGLVVSKGSSKRVTLLADAAGTYRIRVGGAPATAILSATFKIRQPRVKRDRRTVTPDEPKVTGALPNLAAPGTEVSLHGENFRPGVGIAFNGVFAPNAAFVSPTEVSIRVPQSALDDGPADVAATNPDGQGHTLASALTIEELPVVTSVAPGKGTAGDVVTVSGDHFTPGSTVLIGATSANTTYVSSTELQAVVPDGLPIGTVLDVTVEKPHGQQRTLAGGFEAVFKLTGFLFVDAELGPLPDQSGDDVPRDARLLFGFSGEVDPASVNQVTVLIGIPVGGGTFNNAVGRFEIDPGDPTRLLFNPAVDEFGQARPLGFDSQTTHEVQLTLGGVQHTSGAGLDEAFDAVFTTGRNHLPDSIEPQILTSDPVDGATAVSPVADVELSFLSAMNPESLVLGETVLVENLSTVSRVLGTLRLSADAKTLTFHPVVGYGNGFHLIRVTLTTEVKSLSGNALPADVQISFTTEYDPSQPNVGVIEESFSNRDHEDRGFHYLHALAAWNPQGDPGKLI
ncbi:MAG: IPT/TIG domain-containing protein, partial [Planctomycetota bacterium]